MKHLKFTPLNGKPICIMFSQRDIIIKKSAYANVFPKNLDTLIDNKVLLDTFFLHLDLCYVVRWQLIRMVNLKV